MAAEFGVDVHRGASRYLLGLFDTAAMDARGFFEHCGYRMSVQSSW